MYCERCGKPVGSGDEWCTGCGARIAVAEFAAVPASPREELAASAPPPLPGDAPAEAGAPPGPAVALCWSCDVKLDEGARYCADCGADQQAFVAQPAPVEPVATPASLPTYQSQPSEPIPHAQPAPPEPPPPNPPLATPPAQAPTQVSAGAMQTPARHSGSRKALVLVCCIIVALGLAALVVYRTLRGPAPLPSKGATADLTATAPAPGTPDAVPAPLSSQPAAATQAAPAPSGLPEAAPAPNTATAVAPQPETPQFHAQQSSPRTGSPSPAAGITRRPATSTPETAAATAAPERLQAGSVPAVQPVPEAPRAQPPAAQPQEAVSEPALRKAAPAAAPQESRPPAPQIPEQGTVVWAGDANKDQLLKIEKDSATYGRVTGALPGVPCTVTVQPTDVGIAEAPGPGNGFSRIVLRFRRNIRTNVIIKWNLLR